MKAKKILAVTLSATMVIGCTAGVAAADANGATSEGTSAGHVDKEVTAVTLPTDTSVANIFNYTVDPEGLIAAAGTDKTGKKLVFGYDDADDDTGVYFANGVGVGPTAVSWELTKTTEHPATVAYKKGPTDTQSYKVTVYDADTNAVVDISNLTYAATYEATVTDEYVSAAETTFDATATYYVSDNGSYTEVDNPVAGDLATYFTKSENTSWTETKDETDATPEESPYTFSVYNESVGQTTTIVSGDQILLTAKEDSEVESWTEDSITTISWQEDDPDNAGQKIDKSADVAALDIRLSVNSDDDSFVAGKYVYRKSGTEYRKNAAGTQKGTLGSDGWYLESNIYDLTSTEGLDSSDPVQLKNDQLLNNMIDIYGTPSMNTETGSDPVVAYDSLNDLSETFDEGSTITVSQTSYSNTSDPAIFIGANSVDVDVTVSAEVSNATTSGLIDLVDAEDDLDDVEDGSAALYLAMQIGSTTQAISSEKATTAIATITGKPANFEVSSNGSAFAYQTKANLTEDDWNKAELKLYGAVGGDSAAGMVAPEVELTWTVGKHTDGPSATMTSEGVLTVKGVTKDNTLTELEIVADALGDNGDKRLSQYKGTYTNDSSKVESDGIQVITLGEAWMKHFSEQNVKVTVTLKDGTTAKCAATIEKYTE